MRRQKEGSERTVESVKTRHLCQSTPHRPRTKTTQNHEDHLLCSGCCPAVVYCGVQRIGAQGAGVQQQPGRVWQAQHPDLPGDGLPPPGDHHRAAEERRAHPQCQSDRPVLRQDLALPPVQVCRNRSRQGGEVCVQGHAHRQKDSPRLGTQHVDVRRLSSGATNLISSDVFQTNI